MSYQILVATALKQTNMYVKDVFRLQQTQSIQIKADEQTIHEVAKPAHPRTFVNENDKRVFV